jgi:hypothetical protein
VRGILASQIVDLLCAEAVTPEEEREAHRAILCEVRRAAVTPRAVSELTRDVMSVLLAVETEAVDAYVRATIERGEVPSVLGAVDAALAARGIVAPSDAVAEH